MVLAAGLGTRLRPLGDLCPKALMPVGDRPALAHLLGRLRAAGAERIVVNAHHRADDIQRFVRGDGGGVVVSEEALLLGTAGGVAKAGPLLGAGDVLVWNADILADVDASALVAKHRSNGADATLVVEPRAPGEGPVGLDVHGRVVRLRRERFGDEHRGGEFLGVSVLGASLRGSLPERGCLVADAWIPRLRAGARLGAFEHRGAWHDIGTVASYLEANLSWLRARGLTRWIGPGARVEGGVELEQAVLGAGAVVAGAGVLGRCVVWPNARAAAPMTACVVAPEPVGRVDVAG